MRNYPAIICMAFLLIISAQAVSAQAPSAPSLTVSVDGSRVDLSWTAVSGATGYNLYYAAPPELEIGFVNMFTATSLSANLPVGSKFYVAIRAYNGDGESVFSNVEYFEITASVSCSAFTLPPGVSLEYISGDASNCIITDPSDLGDSAQCMAGCGQDYNCIMECLESSGNMFNAFADLAMGLRNDTGSDITFTIGPGYTFEPQDGGSQTMMLLEPLTVTASPGSSTACIPTYCIDPQLDAPGGADHYALGCMVTNPCILERIEYYRTHEAAMMFIQDEIWACVEGR